MGTRITIANKKVMVRDIDSRYVWKIKLHQKRHKTGPNRAHFKRWLRPVSSIYNGFYKSIV